MQPRHMELGRRFGIKDLDGQDHPFEYNMGNQGIVKLDIVRNNSRKSEYSTNEMHNEVNHVIPRSQIVTFDNLR